MGKAITPAMGDDLDEAAETNRSDNPRFEDIVARRYSRRAALFGGMGATAAAMFGLSACSGGGGGGDAPPTINISVDAGAPQAVNAGRVVTLTGASSSSFAGAVTAGSWSQVSGPPVTLTAVSGTVSTFIAPAVSAATPLVFRYTATTGTSNSTADVTVTVNPAVLGFASVARNLNDIVTVPAGYTATVLYALGDPIAAGVPAYANNGTDANFAARAGDHHDALYFYGLAATGTARDDASNARGLLVMNHENITQPFLHPAGPTGTGAGQSRPEAEVVKEMEAHGVSMVEVTRGAQGWSYVQAGSLNRRVTPMTVMSLNGPVRGDAQVRTLFSPDGTQGRGTINNCANGYSAWGTYLTCEENWAFYFRRDRGDNANRPVKDVVSLNRNGIREGAAGNYGWTTVAPADAANTAFRRWNATAVAGAPANGTGDFRNEPNQFGWVVEIDPYDPASTPRKRTALGRFAHEGAWPAAFVAGRRPVYYMGDDNRGDYIYKFVSATAWDPADAQRPDRLAVGDKYLDNGTLYVARFNEDGTGAWLPLTFGQGPLTPANAAYPFASQADVLINTRLAGDALGATRMDRPEWGAVNPLNNEVYMTLTNSNFSNRSPDKTNAANPRSYSDQRTRVDGSITDQTGNPQGHIIRFREAGGNSEATSFNWDIFLFGADETLNPTNVNISGLNATNEFGSPDGLWFARPSNPSGLVKPVLWIQTDDGSLTDKTNNQMLAAMPGVVGDGAARTITNTSGGLTGQQGTFVGQPATAVDLRRFCVGPRECEITGIDSTPDGRAIFINIQHPGEDTEAGDFQQNKYSSNWPASQTTPTAVSRPRSATVVITKNDGGVVGL